MIPRPSSEKGLRHEGRHRGISLRIALASDHAGFRYKERLRKYLSAQGYQIVDFGTDSETPVDYPDFVRPAAQAVARGEVDRGLVLGGSGNGEAMCANRIRGVRCAVCWNEESARLARAHNDANMIALGQRILTEAEVVAIVDAWLATEFEGGRHLRRVLKLDDG
jgi:ribose 5-phosphate isomerase B